MAASGRQYGYSASLQAQRPRALDFAGLRPRDGHSSPIGRPKSCTRTGAWRRSPQKSMPELDEGDKAALVGVLKRAIKADPFPMSPRIRTLRAILTKLEPFISTAAAVRLPPLARESASGVIPVLLTTTQQARVCASGRDKAKSPP